ncbi:SGNH/GDSL hydrolase family protein [Bordetella genomosp. 12]|uniref:Capsular biosynthesis protein n=1 Tax=Bordetella genomosp. 12 TaxID=463035 RepID=A0A261VCG8_9BORD|nr:SGNH/GDSL hydrolase family protein [Bordetella genomosp. 12]OZI70853.1 capsular biosynthesis protein [Bordetella genomosp. 12]
MHRRTLLSAMLLATGYAVLPSVARGQTPYAVVIGDSIAEGEIHRKGRLNVQGRFVPTYPSNPGQLSYELAHYSGIFHFNHGIGGQTSSQVRERWRRDALAEQYDPGDGRGASTLPAGTLPRLIYLHVGINDIALGMLPLQTMQENFTYFARTAAEKNIPLVVDNIGAYLGMTDAMIQQANAFNTWLTRTLAPKYPQMRVVDYLRWSSGGSNDYRKLAPGMFADGVHPAPVGYAAFARHVHETLKLPASSSVQY